MMARILPQGVYSLLPAILSTIGWIASLSKDICDYSIVSGPIVSKITSAKESNIPYLQMGFVAYREPIYNDETDSWAINYAGECREYETELLDVYWHVAKAFAFMAVVVGGSSAFFFWLNICCTFSRPFWRLLGYQVMTAFLFQSLSFLWFGTPICIDRENECNLFYGSATNIGAALAWLISSIFVLCWYPTPSQRRDVVIRISKIPSRNDGMSKSFDNTEGFVLTSSLVMEGRPENVRQIVEMNII
jgi:hypothetical protein